MWDNGPNKGYTCIQSPLMYIPIFSQPANTHTHAIEYLEKYNEAFRILRKNL